MPSDEARTRTPDRRILDAARTLFLDEGFDGVTTDALAAAAGVSKSSIYKYFADMNGVLRGVAELEVERLEFDAAHASGRLTGRGLLADFGTRLLQKVLSPEAVRFDLLIYEGARTDPAIAKIYFESLIAKTQDGLADLIRREIDGGRLVTQLDPDEAAGHLLAMWQGTAVTRARLGLPVTRGRAHLDAWSTRCVDALLR